MRKMRNAMGLALLTACVAVTAAFAQAQGHLTAADEARLKTLIAQHQRVRARLPLEQQNVLGRLSTHVRERLFAAPAQGKLLPSALQIVKETVPSLSTQEATSLVEYTLGEIASASVTPPLQEKQTSFNLQYLQLQSQMQTENRRYTAISNIMKTRHDTLKNSISNVR